MRLEAGEPRNGVVLPLCVFCEDGGVEGMLDEEDEVVAVGIEGSAGLGRSEAGIEGGEAGRGTSC